MLLDETYMQQALDLAVKGLGRTSPNPMVGCLIVKNGQIIGQGYHEKAGFPHAEINALRSATEDPSGSTIYVSLEPCCHYGRTPPCVDALIDAKPSRVVVAMPDPNPRVAGKGIFLLRQAGIEVTVGVLEEKARRLNEVFIKYITTKKPFVIAKCAMSLDGKIATHAGDSRWVTGEAARHKVHELRNIVDAILVGSRTVMLDDPSLTTRLPEGKIKDPIRIILDADAYLDSNRRVFRLDSPAPTWVVVPEGGEFNGADEVIRIRPGQGGIDMNELMEELGRREITSVLIEGGGTTLASTFEAGVVDKVMFFIAPKIVGGREAITAVEGNGVARMADAIRLCDVKVTPIEEDFLFEGYVAK